MNNDEKKIEDMKKTHMELSKIKNVIFENKNKLDGINTYLPK